MKNKKTSNTETKKQIQNTTNEHKRNQHITETHESLSNIKKTIMTQKTKLTKET